MRRLRIPPAVLIALIASLSAARADSRRFDEQMQPVLDLYLTIPKTLAADETEGVQRVAEKIAGLTTELDPGAVTGGHRSHVQKIPQQLEAAAEKLAAAEDIAAMRDALKDLSKPMALWATLRKPDGVSVMYCSMAPGSWLQKDDTRIANPYYGSKMLRCGEIVAGPGAGSESGHMKSEPKDESDGHGRH